MGTRSRSGAAALCAALLLGGCAAADGSGGAETPASAPAPPVLASAPPVASSPVTAPDPAAAAPARTVGVEPARLSVPAIGLDEPLIALGIQSDGAMEVPADYDDVGWFSGGGRPGGSGRTVIAAHVDSRSGPAVFFRLGELAPGDEIAVSGVDGSEHRYRVTAVESHAKAAFPTARVFGATLEEELILVTCGGEYDAAIGRYRDNLLVFASPL
ncbi:class F sortase [Rathayibacter sp. AY1B1]|nr:class F sortase [Rathayibacter sp. AY1B6]PPI30910.1 class F sortase [Rathayibacter sp. AY1B1]